MKKRTAIFTIAILALVTLAFAAPASAQTDNNQPGVARVSFIHGDVSMQRGDSGDTSAVDRNTPLVAGDKVFTGAGARAEVQLDWANLLRMDQNAQADIGTLDQTRIQVQLAQGLAFYSVLKGSDADVEIDTPNVSITPHGQGRYRIEVTPSGDTLVTVRDGQADVSTPDGSTLVKEGETITVRGTGNDEQFQVSRAPSNDEFDKWNSDRDRVIANAESSRRTNPYYTGASDMDAYGRWTEVPDYGWVWSPRVAVGWAPYRHGRWVWESYWGWTWVSDEPWGWAPYHYGRWFVHANSWVWWPGPVTRVYRPVYAPAYVSFFGFGAHSGVSVGVSFGGGFGSIGWLPAGPCDYVNPWWGSHRNNFNVVNVTNVTNVYNVRNVNMIAPMRGGNRDSNIHNMLVNNQVRYGLSTVSSESFGHGRDNVRTVSTTELREGHMMTGNVPVVPSRESLRTSDRPAGNFATSHAQTQDHFFSRRVPSTQHESFNDESSRVQQSLGQSANGGPGNRNADNRPADNRGGPENRGQDNRPAANAGGFGNRNGNNNAPAVTSQRQAPQGAQAQTPAADSGARRGSDNNRGADNNNASNNNGNNNGWRRFGGGQAGSDNPQGQATPQLRAPRQNGAGVESAQNRAATPQNQTQTPANNGQRVSPSTNPERPAQSGATNQRPAQGPANQGPPNQTNGQSNGNPGNGNRNANHDDSANRDNNANRDSGPSSAGPSSAGGQGGWQRFSDAPRGAAAAPSTPHGQNGGNSNQGNFQSSPRSDNRTPIELNRPIIQQRNNPAGVERNASRPDPSPNTNQRVAPAPRPSQQASAPSSAPQTYSRPEAPSRSGGGYSGGNDNRSSGGGGGGSNSGGGAHSSASSNSSGHGNGRNR